MTLLSYYNIKESNTMKNMNILLTGATGYIGSRLLYRLVMGGHHVLALVRNRKKIHLPDEVAKYVTIYEGDVTNLDSLKNLPKQIDAAYYLIHAMRDDPNFFSEKDRQAALYFREALLQTQCKQIIYLSGLIRGEKPSKHLSSRLEVEQLLQGGGIPVTSLRSSIIVGEGSASFEIIRDLTEKLPIMIAPRWVKQKCQPIAIIDVLDYLTLCLLDSRCFNKTFEIGGPEIIEYQNLLLRYAKHRGLKRKIFTVPVLTPKLSSYWLIFITSTNYSLARSLVDSLKSDSYKEDTSIDALFPKDCLSYEESLDRALQKISQNPMVSNWKEIKTTTDLSTDESSNIQVPTFGSYSIHNQYPFSHDPDLVMYHIFALGGKKGYYMNWVWKARGKIDRLFGGQGYAKTGADEEKLKRGSRIHFWEVVLIEEKKRRLLLFGRLKVPGEVWLDFKILPEKNNWMLHQTLTYRPKGLRGRFYWLVLYPIHLWVFKGLGNKWVQKGK